MLRDSIPAGFRTASKATGLIVPVETDREREVWTKDEFRLIDRATKFLQSKGIRFQFACSDERCRGDRMELVRDGRSGDVTLQCNHKARVMVRAL